MNYYRINLVDYFLNKKIDSCFVKSFKTKKDLLTYLEKYFNDRYQFRIKKCLKRDIPTTSFCLYETEYKIRCDFIKQGSIFFTNVNLNDYGEINLTPEPIIDFPQSFLGTISNKRIVK